MDFQKSIQRLSSGLRINSAADDPAGLALSQTLTAQVNGFDQASRNIQDAISMVQVADGALNDTAQALQRMRQLSVQAASDTLTNGDRANIQAEIQNLVQEIDRISGQTEFNSKKLLDGSAGGVQVGGGGTDIKAASAQAGVTLNPGVGSQYTISKTFNATVSAVEGANVASNGAIFTQNSVLSIQGPTGAVASFTATAGETLESFIQQVNNSSLGVTMYVDDGTSVAANAGKLVIANNYAGIKTGAGGDGNGTVNLTGAVAVNVTVASGDFASASGLKLGLDATTLGIKSNGSTTGAYSYTAGAAGRVNALIQIKLNNAAVVGAASAGTGLNGDFFQGSGSAAGLSFTVNDPTNITGGTSNGFTIVQNTALNLQTSPNAGESIHLSLDAMNSQTLGVSGLNLSTQAGAQSAISTLDNAISTLSVYRSQVGTFQTRLTNTLTNASLAEENLTSARSQIQDANIATETTNFTRTQILLQAGTSVLAQANQSPTGLLALLR
jgi:flagellin